MSVLNLDGDVAAVFTDWADTGVIINGTKVTGFIEREDAVEVDDNGMQLLSKEPVLYTPVRHAKASRVVYAGESWVIETSGEHVNGVFSHRLKAHRG